MVLAQPRTLDVKVKAGELKDNQSLADLAFDINQALLGLFGTGTSFADLVNEDGSPAIAVVPLAFSRSPVSDLNNGAGVQFKGLREGTP